MKKSVGVLLGILMILMFASSANATVLLQQTISNNNPPISQVDNRYGWIGQSIKESQGVNNLGKIILKIGCNDCPGSGMSVYVMTSSNPAGGGYPSGIILTSAFVPNSAIPPPSANYTFVLNSIVNLAANTEYWVVIEGYRIAPPAHHLAAWYEGSGGIAYPNGLVRWRYWDGMTWTDSEIRPNADLYFILESAPPPPLKMPFPNGTSHYCTQGANGSYSHQASSTKYDLDLATSQSTDEDVVAAASGTAYTHAGSTGFGNHISIDHGNGYFTLYAHLKSFSVTNGQSVSQGQVIGKEDCTGSPCTGDHLHFGLHTGDPTINALNSTSVLAGKITTKDVTAGGSFVEITSDEFICEDPDGTGHFYESNNTAP